MINSRLGLFTAALQGLHPKKHPFSRSYGVILPSSLTRVLSLTLGFSPRLPVSVCGTGRLFLTRSFSWQCDIKTSVLNFPPHHNLSLEIKAFDSYQDLLLERTYPTVRTCNLLRPSIVQTKQTGTGISTCYPSPTPIGLGLGPD